MSNKAKIAVIAAAGWKGVGTAFPDVPRGCPESLLPLLDGETVVSRQAKQLKELGYRIFICVGQPGSLFPKWASIHCDSRHLITEEGAKQGRVESPWTWERVDYVAQFGYPILIPNPDRGTRHRTNLIALDMLGPSDYDVLLTAGDYLLTDELIADIAGLSVPHQYQHHQHAVLLLNNKETVPVYRRLCVGGGRTWNANKSARALELEESVPLERFAAERYDEFMDIDVPAHYKKALWWIKQVTEVDTQEGS